MAVTRIKNNQITDASGANTQLGVNAAVKLQNYSVTAGKLANSLVYGSDLTVQGNLTVNGQTTTVDTVNTLIKDPILTLADGQVSGTPTVDIGLLGLRGSQNSSFMGWQESGTTFMAILSNTTASNTTVNVTSYANFTASTITAQANLSVIGNIVGTANFTGNVNAGNILTPGIMSSTGNATHGNILTGGLISATSTITGSSLLGSVVSASGNVTGGNVLTGGLISATGNATAGNVLTGGVVSAVGNITANTGSFFIGNGSQLTGVTASTSGFPVTAGTSNIAAATNGNIGITVGGASNVALFTTAGALVTGLISANGNVTGGNLNAGSGAISTTGNVYTGNVINTGTSSATGNVTGGNVLTGGLVSATGNVTAGNVNVGSGAVSTTGNVYAGNVINTGISSVTGNVTGGNILTGGLISATGNLTSGNVNTTNISLSGNVISALNVTGNTTSGNLLTPGVVSATGNITGGNVTGAIISASGNVTTPIVKSTAAMTISTGSGDLTLNPTGNVTMSSKNITGLADPAQAQDAATKAYVDNTAQGLDVKASCLVATVSNLATATGGTITYNNGTAGVGANLVTTGTYLLIDGGNVQTVGSRILVKNEANAAWNGIYTYTSTTVITRSTDFDNEGTNGQIPGAFTFIEIGTVNDNTGWVCTTNNPVVMGTTAINFSQFSGAGTYTANTSAGISLTGTVFSALVDNNTTAFDGGGNIIVKAGANLTTPNIGAATGTSLSVTGAVNAGTTMSATGNIKVGNVLTGGLISATSNITTAAALNGANLSLSGNVISPLNVTGNITAGNITNLGISSVVGNVIAGNVLTGGLVSATGNVNGGNVISSSLVQGVTVSASGNVIGGNVSTGGLITATGNVTGGNVLTGGLISATGNATSGNVLTGGLVSATGNITGGNLLTSGSGGAISGTGNITGGNILTGGLISATGTLAAGNTTITGFANVSNGVISVGSYVGANITDGIIVDYVTGNGRITVGSADGFNIYNGPNAGNTLIASFNTTGALTLGTTGTANITAGNALVSGQVSATANITGGNVLTGGLVSATGNGTFGNIVLTGNFINQLQANSVINVNGASANTNFAVNGTTANLIYVNATTNTVGIGNSATLVNAIASFNAVTSIVLPTGTTGQRPSNASSQTGMVRFNTSTNGLEIFDNAVWTSVGGTTFTVIADEQFNGDGSTVAFTLGSSQTTNSCLVSINGVVQIPTSAYSVAGTYPTCVLTFTEAPAAGDLIDVREITTTTTVTAISNNSGNAQITGSPTSAAITVLGNLIPTANVTYTLGNATNYWKSLYVGGNTIYLGGLQLQSAAGNVFSVTTDGTTPANITIGGAGNVITTGNVSGGNLITTSGFIVNGGSNGVGNIGSTGTYFNTVFAKATSAQYADLAEKYVADAEYAPGVVVSFGGDKEVTRSEVDADRAVAGVVSTNPSYIMNATLEAEHVAVVAFTGRVPTSVTGSVAKGDLMVSNGDGTARSEADPKAGSIIGKALENFSGDAGVIEVVIGRF